MRWLTVKQDIYVDEFLTNTSAYQLDEQSTYFYKNTPPLFYDSFNGNEKQQNRTVARAKSDVKKPI